jgi:hypothetical protein
MTDPPSYIRQSQLHRYFPVLSASTWRRLIREGALPSRHIATKDVECFLAGSRRAEPA